MPVSVERPPDAAAIARRLKQASDDKCAVVPLGGGTMLDLGAPATPGALALSLSRLNRVLDHQPANLTVKTEAGITLGALNAALAERGQMLPLDPPFPDRATVGGIIATNASGPLRVRFGAARDLLIGLRVALTDGQIVHGGGDVVKNVAGYDLPKLFTGSLGTLGIITEASFKIVPLPAHTATVVAAFASLDHAAAHALQVLHSPLLPSGVELLNPAAASTLGLGAHYTSVVRFGGLKSAVGQQLRETEKWGHAQGAIQVDTVDADADLWARLRDVMYEQATLCKLSVLPTQLREMGAAAEEIARAHGLTCTFQAHAVGVLLTALDGAEEQLVPAMTALRQATAARQGHLVVQRASRDVRSRVDVWGPTGNDFAVMQRLKADFDPNHILNPGRFVGGL
ncbi:MAG: FAD-binding oxidoreductase [Anaerolineae bacterium]